MDLRPILLDRLMFPLLAIEEKLPSAIRTFSWPKHGLYEQNKWGKFVI